MVNYSENLWKLQKNNVYYLSWYCFLFFFFSLPFKNYEIGHVCPTFKSGLRGWHHRHLFGATFFKERNLAFGSIHHGQVTLEATMTSQRLRKVKRHGWRVL